MRGRNHAQRRGDAAGPAEEFDLAPAAPLADTPAEVDATFRTQRRIVFGYFAIFLLVTLAVPALTLVLDWWSEGRLVGGMSPAFVMTAAGLYLFFFLLALAASSLSATVEDRMLGQPPPSDEDWAER
jgi:hypothetical protein